MLLVWPAYYRRGTESLVVYIAGSNEQKKTDQNKTRSSAEYFSVGSKCFFPPSSSVLKVKPAFPWDFLIAFAWSQPKRKIRGLGQTITKIIASSACLSKREMYMPFSNRAEKAKNGGHTKLSLQTISRTRKINSPKWILVNSARVSLKTLYMLLFKKYAAGFCFVQLKPISRLKCTANWYWQKSCFFLPCQKDFSEAEPWVQSKVNRGNLRLSRRWSMEKQQFLHTQERMPILVHKYQITTRPTMVLGLLGSWKSVALQYLPCSWLALHLLEHTIFFHQKEHIAGMRANFRF